MNNEEHKDVDPLEYFTPEEREEYARLSLAVQEAEEDCRRKIEQLQEQMWKLESKAELRRPIIPNPWKEHPAFDQYFRLAVETEMTPQSVAQIEQAAQDMLKHATEMGLEHS
jgi:hypothetical protein